MTKVQLGLLGTVTVASFLFGALATTSFAHDKATGKPDKPALIAEIKARHQAVHEALDNKDFEAFKEAVKNKPHFDESKLTQENFDKMLRVHELMKEGKKEEANKLREELGLPKPPHNHKGKGMHHRHHPNMEKPVQS